MVSLKQKQSGFTIVELLIVIVIIGILATLVIVTFSGVQQKARDSERKTDINAIANVLEAFYANKGYYPSAGEITPGSAFRSDATISADFKLDDKSLADPKAPNDKSLVATAPVAGTYRYYYQATGCSGSSAADPWEQCTGFTLTANLENVVNGVSTFERKSN